MNQPLERPATIRRHRRQFFWQILLPVLVILALLISGAVFLVAGDGANPGLWANVSTIWLALPVLLFTLLGIIVLCALIYAIARLYSALPRFTARAQQLASRMESGARRVADGAAEPIVRLHQAGLVLNQFIDALVRRFKE